MNIQRITAEHPAFPANLKTVYQPPKAVYFRGSIEFEPGVAVVGTRKISPYGRSCVDLLVPELVRLGQTVVSGLAFGIDAAAHLSALDSGGTTVAVIGTGVDDDSIYPRADLELARRIIKEGGCLMSEYPPGTPGFKNHFPERNRIIAGLSRAVLVIEAPEKSGAMITARLALESGRDVWAVPGPITHPNGWGPNRLIRDGATPIANLEDLRHALGFQEPLFSPLKGEKNKSLSGREGRVSLQDPSGFATSPFRGGITLTDEECGVIELLTMESLSADQISKRLGKNIAAVSILLTRLELKGLVRSLGGGRFSLYT